MSKFEVLLDFLYVIAQRRLSSARYLMKSGGYILVGCLGIGSAVGSITNGTFTLTADSSSSPVLSIIINFVVIIGIICFTVGFIIEVYERLVGEAATKNRSKSIDLRSLSQAHAPKLSRSFPSLIESSGIQEDLYLAPKGNEVLSDWLSRSTLALNYFAKNHLSRLNKYENEHPLALGAQAHVPHCFVLGFLIANRRLINYYCWNRDLNKDDKSRWIDCRDRRTKGLSTDSHIKTILASNIDDKSKVKKLGLSIEVSIASNPDSFMSTVGLDAVCQIGVKNQTVGNLFSEKEQVKIINEIRYLLNNTLKSHPVLTELHITITAQASFIMRLGADFNQNHFPPVIKVYHFENQGYPWCFNVSPNKDSVEYSMLRDSIGETA